MVYLKPPRLSPGETVALVSTSWGGPAVFPQVFMAGVSTLMRRFGLHVREYPTTRLTPAALARDPESRAADLNRAFADDSVAAIISSIGGDDSARILPHLDPDVI